MISANTISENTPLRSVIKITGMNTLGSRIKHYRNIRGLSQRGLALACGWKSQSRVGNYEKDAREPNLDDIKKIAEVLKVNRADLLADDGAPEKIGSPSEKEYALIPQFKARGSCGDGYLNDHVEVTEGLVFKRDWLSRMKAKPENLRIIYAEGDSMEPYIFEGDVVLFDSSKIEPQDRHAYVVLRPDGGVSIKRLIQQLSGSWLIRSDNSDKSKYPDEQLSPDALHEIPIIGRVIWRAGEM